MGDTSDTPEEQEDYRVGAYKADHISNDPLGQLSELVDKIWGEISSFGIAPSQQGEYERRRKIYLQAAALATITDHDKRAEILQGWDKMQSVYARMTCESIRRGRPEYIGLVKTSDEDIARLRENEEEFRQITARIATKRTPEDTQRMRELLSEIDKLDMARNDREEHANVLAHIDRAVAELSAFLKLPGVERIHYRLMSKDQILDRLGKGTYDSIPFKPFEMAGRGKIINHLVVQSTVQNLESKTDKGSKKITPLRLQEKPDLLENLLGLKRVIDVYVVGSEFISGDVTYDELSSKAIGGYLWKGKDLFGVKAEKKSMGQGNFRRVFKKLAGTPMSEQHFIGGILKILNATDLGEVNIFYLEKTLLALREDKRGYPGFKAEDVTSLCRERFNYPLERRSVGVNFGKYPEKYGITVVDEHPPRRYKFAEIIPTERQFARVREVVPGFGFEEFTTPNIFDKTGIPPAVIVHILDHEKGVNKLAPHKYQRSERPPSLGEQADARQPNPGTTEMF